MIHPPRSCRLVREGQGVPSERAAAACGQPPAAAMLEARSCQAKGGEPGRAGLAWEYERRRRASRLADRGGWAASGQKGALCLAASRGVPHLSLYDTVRR